MKNMKKLFALMLAVLMLLSVACFASAEETNEVTVTINSDDLSSHKFTAYPIFTGSQAQSEGALGNVQWGDGFDGTGFLAALQADSTFDKDGTNAFTDCADASSVAAVMGTYNNKSVEANQIAKLAYQYKGATGSELTAGTNKLAKGYYLIVDETWSEEDDPVEGAVHNTALLQVTNDITIEAKKSVPEVQKKVKDINDSSAEGESDWQDSADHDIEDAVSFQLKATLADNVSDYETYQVIFHDTLSEGFTFNSDSVKIFIDNQEYNNADNKFVITSNGTQLTFSCADVKALGATNKSEIIVEYTAALNENAVIGSEGNPNEVYLEYSNNPNESQAGNGYTGKTPVDKVIVFTYQLNVEKTDSEGSPLSGAKFTLSKKDANGVYVSLGEVETQAIEVAGDGEKVTKQIASWVGLDDGEYKLEETVTPEGYNTIVPVEFTITATHDEEAAEPALLTFTGDLATGTYDLSSGIVTTTIENKTGATLPETGGIGTTIFYVAGGVLVLLAVVLLVTKRRVGEN